MRDALRWVEYLLLAVIVGVVLAFAFYRLRGPTRAQLDALALLQKDYEPKHGRNAFALLWFMSYDVPADAMNAKVREDVASFEKRLIETQDPFSYDPPEAKLPEAGADYQRLCAAKVPGCLAKVQADRNAIRASLAAFPVALARQSAFDKVDFYWDEFPADYRALIAPVPSYLQRVWLSGLALRFADGDRAGALAGTCRNINAWRNVQRGNNSLTMRMIAVTYVDGGLLLFADMLAQMPADSAIPADCENALRPVEGVELDRCAEMAREEATSDNLMSFLLSRETPWWERALAWATLERTQARAWRAESDGTFCTEASVPRMLRDEPVRVDRLPRITGRLECIASFYGCVLADIGSPVYAEYDQRILDFAAHLRLAATLLWLRNGADDRAPAERFEQRPALLRTGSRASGIDPDKGIVFVANLRGPPDTRFELPIAKGLP